jgi:hypothetical protein
MISEYQMRCFSNSAVSSSYDIVSNGRIFDELEKMSKGVLSRYLFKGTEENLGLIGIVCVLAEI